MHCNLRPPKPRQPFPALITTPCQVWRRWTYTLPYYSIFAADTLRYAMTLTFWHLTLHICSISSVMWWNSTKFEGNRTIRGKVIAISVAYLTLWPWTCFKCCAWLWDHFHQVWPSTTYPCLNYSIFYAGTLCHAVILIFDPLTLKVRGTSSVTWSKSVRNLSKMEQSSAELLIILQFSHMLCHAMIWHLTLNFYSTSGVMCLNSVQNLSKIK